MRSFITASRVSCLRPDPRGVAEVAFAHVVGSQVERAYARSDLLDQRRAVMAA